MSWDATLLRDDGSLREWNYTHNCNGMANAVIDSDYEQRAVFKEVFGQSRYQSWWKRLDGMSGLQGGLFLGEVIDGLRAEPERFRAMNPENGWGSYDQFLGILIEMRDAVTEMPARWSVDG